MPNINCDREGGLSLACVLASYPGILPWSWGVSVWWMKENCQQAFNKLSCNISKWLASRVLPNSTADRLTDRLSIKDIPWKGQLFSLLIVFEGLSMEYKASKWNSNINTRRKWTRYHLFIWFRHCVYLLPTYYNIHRLQHVNIRSTERSHAMMIKKSRYYTYCSSSLGREHPLYAPFSTAYWSSFNQQGSYDR